MDSLNFKKTVFEYFWDQMKLIEIKTSPNQFLLLICNVWIPVSFFFTLTRWQLKVMFEHFWYDYLKWHKIADMSPLDNHRKLVKPAKTFFL